MLKLHLPKRRSNFFSEGYEKGREEFSSRPFLLVQPWVQPRFLKSGTEAEGVQIFGEVDSARLHQRIVVLVNQVIEIVGAFPEIAHK
ncbi:MAG: hypothetical protein K2O37_04045, partial [Bacteroidales bacterium]|nr:hypothetical protein [Bacteroidales bacterium]